MKGRWVGALLAASSLCAAMLASTPPHAAQAATSPVSLGTHSFGRILVDPASSQVFVSSPSDNSIVVLDLTGNIVKTITGETGAGAMVVAGTILYVTLSTGAIEKIPTGSLVDAGALVSGLVSPTDLVYAAGKLWTTTGACGGTGVQLASVDPSAISPTVSTYSGAFTAGNELDICAFFATNHASNPNFILAWHAAGDHATVTTFDVSGVSPVQTDSVSESRLVTLEDVAINPDGAHFVAASGWPYEFDQYNLSDLTQDGVVYPANPYPAAVDTSSANGGVMALGVAGYTGNDFYAYRIGNPATRLAQVDFGASSNVVPSRGVAIGPDGTTAYAVSMGSGSGLLLNLVPLMVVPPNGAPAPPVSVSATAGVGAAVITWTAPSFVGSSAIKSYTVHSSGGAMTTVNASTYTALLAGLSPVAHTFTVTATNSNADSAPSAPSNTVTPLDGGTFNPLTPARILDTRTGNGGFPIRRVGANSAISLQVTGRAGVPMLGVGAVVMNVTVTNSGGAGYLVAYPTGFARPLASNINFTRGSTVPNLVEVAVGSAGKVDLFVGGASADVVADVEGWVGDSTDSYFSSGLFQALGPVRVWDSRAVSTANGNVHEPLGPGQTLTIPGGVGLVGPGLVASLLNVTVTNPTTAGYLTVFPAGSPRPLASNLNFTAGQTVANRVIVLLGSNSGVSIYNAYGTVDVVVDNSGFFGSQGSAFVPTVPNRFFDTRTCGCGGRLPPGFLIDLVVASPPMTALSLNLTATNTTAYGFLTVYPDDGSHGGGPVPLASDLNFRPGQTIANMTVVMIPGDMAFNVFNGAGFTDVIVDTNGYYGPVATPLSGSGGPGVPVTSREPRALPRVAASSPKGPVA